MKQLFLTSVYSIKRQHIRGVCGGGKGEPEKGNELKTRLLFNLR